MLSDGIVENNEDNEEIMRLLRSFDSDDFDTLPDKIISEAKKRKGTNDDMTVCVLAVSC